MGIVEKFFKRKEKSSQKQSNLELVKPLFQSYLVSSAANYQSKGYNCLDTRFTSMAIEQPITFYEYCADFYDQILFAENNGESIINSIEGRNNSESFWLRSAFNILEKNFHDPKFKYMCGAVSSVYESALATLNKSRVQLYDAGKDPISAELTYQVVDELKAHYKKVGPQAFTRDGFARQAFTNEGEQAFFRDTTLNSRESISELLSNPSNQTILGELQANPASEFNQNAEADIVDVSLNFIKEATKNTQNLIVNHNREEFMPLATPQE